MNDIVEAGKRRDTTVVPTLIDLLDDEDEGVRFYAILALERITGTRRGYDYASSEAARAGSVRAWRRWLEQGEVSGEGPERTASPDGQASEEIRATVNGPVESNRTP